METDDSEQGNSLTYAPQQAWDNMPLEMTEEIISYLEPRDLLALREVCKKFDKLIRQGKYIEARAKRNAPYIRNRFWGHFRKTAEFREISLLKSRNLIISCIVENLMKRYFAITETTPEQIREYWGHKYYPELAKQGSIEIDKMFVRLGYLGLVEVGIDYHITKVFCEWQKRERN